jgi:hypothetical protein
VVAGDDVEDVGLLHHAPRWSVPVSRSSRYG